MKAWTCWLVGLGIVAACGSDRDPPRTSGSGTSATLVGVGGGQGAGGMAPDVPPCETTGVTCDFYVYHGDCSASPDQQALWEFLNYTTVIPDGAGDAMVEFAVRTATTEAELSDESFSVASIAQMGAEEVFASMPVFLDDALPSGFDQREWLELRVKLVDSSDEKTPRADDWSIQFSCVDI